MPLPNHSTVATRTSLFIDKVYSAISNKPNGPHLTRSTGSTTAEFASQIPNLLLSLQRDRKPSRFSNDLISNKPVAIHAADYKNLSTSPVGTQISNVYLGIFFQKLAKGLGFSFVGITREPKVFIKN